MNKAEKEVINQLNQARNHYLKRDYEKAIKLYAELEKTLKDDSENLPVILIEFGWAYYHNQQYQQAIKKLEEAIDKKKLNPQQIFDCYRIIGFCHEMLRKHDLAIKNLKSALEINIPQATKRYTLFELGKILFTTGQILKAQSYLQEADALFEDSEIEYRTALAYYLGFVDYFEKKFSKAQERFNFIIQRGKDHKTLASGYFGLAHLHYQHKEYEALIDICDKIIRLDDTFFDKETLGYFMCEAYLNLKNWNELETFFSELKNSYPKGRYNTEYPKYEIALKDKKLAE